MHNLLLLMVLFISACSSVPTSYYSLDQTDNVEPAVTKNTSKIKGIQLIMDQIPLQYDRPQLLVLDSKISPEVYVLNESLWVSPLQDQIQRTLANDVAHYLGVPVVNGIPGLDDVNRFIVRIINFDMALNKGSYIEANWSSSFNNAKPQLCKASVTITGNANNVPALVETQKDALRAIAALIALQDGIKITTINEKIVSYNLGCT